MKNIAAVIVTFNRSKLLVKALNSIISQSRAPDIIFIINNASTDDTREVIDAYRNKTKIPIDTSHLEKNTGGAGGFYFGMKKAFEKGFDAFWLMDDDTVPGVDALKMLELDFLTYEKVYGIKAPFICSTVLWKDDEVCVMNIPCASQHWTTGLHKIPSIALVDSCSFVSVLVTRDSVKRSGLPIPEFFIWYDDVEFTKRISRDSAPGILSTRSRVNHLLAENKGTDLESINDSNIWKHSYGVRNEGFVIIRDRGIIYFLYFAAKKLSVYLRLQISVKSKIRLIGSCISALMFKPKIKYPCETIGDNSIKRAIN